eukprot:2413058-Ditylum_brightwellii.AAC.1
MLQVALYVDNHGFKLLPASLLYDKSIRDGKQNYAQLLKEQNQYLSKCEDFCIGGIDEGLLNTKFNNSTLCEKLKLAGVMGDITPTVFTKTKGIWQVETTKDQEVVVMHHVTEILENIQDKIPEGYKNLYSTFPYPCVLNMPALPTDYAKSLVSDVKISENNEQYDKPLPNAWVNGPT